MEKTERLRAFVEAHGDQVLAWRRQIHRRPELGFQERETAALVCAALEGMGLEIRRGLGGAGDGAGTGVLATLDTGRPGPVLILRADMDALPIQEATGLPCASECAGVMHACGHDIHTSVLLGAAQALAGLRDALRGVVKFIFQPAEEAYGGATSVLAEGILDDPAVDCALALHVMPFLSAGTVGVKGGYITGTDDEFTIRVKGLSGHSSMPEQGVNAVTIAAHIITALQSIPAAAVSPFDVATYSVCEIRGGTANNVIPDSAELRGMIRCRKTETKEICRRRMAEICAYTAKALGGTAEVDFNPGFPPVYNDPALAGRVAGGVELALGDPARVLREGEPNLGSDDFGYFVERVPGVYMILGCRPPEGDCGGLHTPQFRPDEACIPVGVQAMAGAVLELCGM